MCARHRPENGADSMDNDFCSYCSKTVAIQFLRRVTIGRSTSLLCDRCFELQQERFARDAA